MNPRYPNNAELEGRRGQMFPVLTDAQIIFICRGSHVLRAPSDAEIADRLGLNETLPPGVVHEVAICGAGPGGLAAAVYGASCGRAA